MRDETAASVLILLVLTGFLVMWLADSAPIDYSQEATPSNECP